MVLDILPGEWDQGTMRSEERISIRKGRRGGRRERQVGLERGVVRLQGKRGERRSSKGIICHHCPFFFVRFLCCISFRKSISTSYNYHTPALPDGLRVFASDFEFEPVFFVICV